MKPPWPTSIEGERTPAGRPSPTNRAHGLEVEFEAQLQFPRAVCLAIQLPKPGERARVGANEAIRRDRTIETPELRMVKGVEGL
jgi:hypothetical protein